MSQKNIIIIIIVTALLLLSFFIFENKITKTKKSSDTLLKTSSDFTKADLGLTVGGKIYYESNQDGVTKIISYDLSQKENKDIFSDIDDDFKLTTLGNFAYLSQEYIALQKNGNKNQIVSLKLSDKVEKKIIFDNFSQIESLAVSSDGQTIFYTTAISVDDLTRHYLYQISRDNHNFRQLYSSDDPISNLSSNKNGDAVVFILNDKNILVLNVDSLKQKEIYSSGNQISALMWHENGDLIFTQSNDQKLSSGKILAIDENGNNLKKILETQNDFPDLPIVSPDFLATVYDLKKFPKDYDANLSGEINFSLIGESILNKIGTGQKIIAWIK